MPPRPVEVIVLPSEIDRLFQLPAAQFTDARNALAVRLKAAMRPADAAQVKALSRPTVSAWAINQLAWQRPEVLDRLRAAGDRLRHEQEQALIAGQRDLRSSMVERRQAVDAAVAAAIDALERDGGTATPATRERIVASSEAIAAFGTTAGAPDVGRLSQDVESPGLAALVSLAAAARAGEQARLPTQGPPASPTPSPPLPATPRDAATAETTDTKSAKTAGRAHAIATRKAVTAARARLAQAENAAAPTRASLAAATRARKEAQADAERAQREADAARVEVRAGAGPIDLRRSVPARRRASGTGRGRRAGTTPSATCARRAKPSPTWSRRTAMAARKAVQR